MDATRTVRGGNSPIEAELGDESSLVAQLGEHELRSVHGSAIGTTSETKVGEG